MYVIKTLTGEEVKVPGYKIPYDAFESFFYEKPFKKILGGKFLNIQKKMSVPAGCSSSTFSFCYLML